MEIRAQGAKLCFVFAVWCGLAFAASDQKKYAWLTPGAAKQLLTISSSSKTQCLFNGDMRSYVLCHIAEKYRNDQQSAVAASQLWEKHAVVPGFDVEQMFDGDYRGKIKLIPALPSQQQRHHLEWIASAFDSFDFFFENLSKKGEMNFRFEPIALKFFVSVGRKTPAAYAADWSIGYNLNGSLQKSSEAVSELLFHEIFHLNDFTSQGAWSSSTLSTIYDQMMNECRRDNRCLKKYAPTQTKVLGGNYYAFHANNGVTEFAAELALRYFRETNSVLHGQKVAEYYKCINDKNAAAWKKISQHFFGNIDLTGDCPK